MSVSSRTRPDRCPGVLRPWPARDGALVRLRLVGGHLPLEALRGLAEVAASYGDGEVHLTKRANLQLRALPQHDGLLDEVVVDAIEATGLLPSRSHELVRNLMASPLSGIEGGRSDVRPLLRELDEGLLAESAMAGLPARFLFALDDGRGDLIHRALDLGVVALGDGEVQLRVGDAWGPVVPQGLAVDRLLTLARSFLAVRGTGPEAAWHVDELPSPLVAGQEPDARIAPPRRGLCRTQGTGWRHLEVSEGVLTPKLVDDVLTAAPAYVVVTPWHGLVLVS